MNSYRAQKRDAAALAVLINSAFRGESSKKGWTTEADFLGGQRTDTQFVEEIISDPAGALLVFKEDEELIGCVLLQRKMRSNYLGMLTVRPDLQSKKLGSVILAEAEAWMAKEWKATSVEIKVIQKRKELIAWYERRGYSDTGRREPFPYGNDRMGLPRVKDLEFVVMSKTLEPKKN